MPTIHVDLGARSYPIYIAPLEPQLLNQAVVTKKVMIVTNETIAPLYLEWVQSMLVEHCSVDVAILPDGEQYKNFEHLNTIFDQLLSKLHSRDTTLIALGGGVIGDMTGFAASCYQRGVNFIQIPTTLLAQVDSSVGGKTAINHPMGKNMIGAFYQPQSVFIDPSTLTTLPTREFNAGMAEVIKYGIIWDAELFSYLEQHSQAIKAKQPEAISHIIARCCEIKAEVVAQDETEQGVRALLNLGHTFGHAIEAEMGYGQWLHGEAVAAGMVQAAQTARQLAWLSDEQVERITALIKLFDLPTQGPETMGYDDYLPHMLRDKKVMNQTIRLILPKSIGHAVVEDLPEPQLLRSILNNH